MLQLCSTHQQPHRRVQVTDHTVLPPWASSRRARSLTPPPLPPPLLLLPAVRGSPSSPTSHDVAAGQRQRAHGRAVCQGAGRARLFVAWRSRRRCWTGCSHRTCRHRCRSRWRRALPSQGPASRAAKSACSAGTGRLSARAAPRTRRGRRRPSSSKTRCARGRARSHARTHATCSTLASPPLACSASNLCRPTDLLLLPCACRPLQIGQAQVPGCLRGARVDALLQKGAGGEAEAGAPAALHQGCCRGWRPTARA